MCNEYITHITSLTRIFSFFSSDKRSKKSSVTSRAFENLLKNGTWYLYEVGELAECRRILDIAIKACDITNWETYAYLCNTYVCLSMDENTMQEGKEMFDMATALREKHLPPGDLDLANSYRNCAVISLSEGRYEDALTHHVLGDKIWQDAGRVDDIYQGLSYLNVGRVYSLRSHATGQSKNLEEDHNIAMRYFRDAERVFTAMNSKVFLPRYALTFRLNSRTC